MSTPAHVFTAYLRSLFLVLSTLSGLGLLISRLYIFYESYSGFTLLLQQEAWLRVQCQDPEFYSKMRHHTDLCAQVEANARTSVILHSLNKVFTSGHICGSKPCMDYVNDLMLQGLLWPALVVVCVFVIMIPSIITSMARGRIWHAQDWHARNLPYRHQLRRPPSSNIAAMIEYGHDDDDGDACSAEYGAWNDLQARHAVGLRGRNVQYAAENIVVTQLP